MGSTSAGSTAKESPELCPSAKLCNAVDTDRILVHERRFQRIVNANDANRASGTPGYDASADYVAGKLRAAGYEVSVQPLAFPFFREVGTTSFLRTGVDPD
jgi:hypothetical protein